MSLDLATFDADIINLIADLPTSITINGQTVSATRYNLTNTDQSGEYGMSRDFDVSVIVAKSEITYPPEIASAVVMDSETYRVTSFTLDPTGTNVKIYLKKDVAKAVAM